VKTGLGGAQPRRASQPCSEEVEKPPGRGMVQYLMPSPVMPSQIGVPFMSVPMPFTVCVPASAPMSHWWVSSPIVGYASVPSNLPHAKDGRLPLAPKWLRAFLPCVPRSTPRFRSDI